MNIMGLQIRNVEFGTGIPKTCVPIAQSTRLEILESAKLAANSVADSMELRLDWYEEHEDLTRVEALLKEIREIIGDKILLCTFRSKNEGGQATISLDAYKQLCKVVCESSCADLLDVEAFMFDGLLEEMCELAHANGVYVVASNHDFDATPSKDEIVKRLQYMDQCGADLPKIAVMPQSKEDVLTLLSATTAYHQADGCKPIITMSMGSMGGITRLAGEIFESALTFTTLGKASAPGQVELEKVIQVMQIIHNSL